MTPPDEPSPPATPAPEPDLAGLSAMRLLGSAASGPDQLDELLRDAARQCRKLLQCETARIWVVRRAGRRLVSREFDEQGRLVRETRLGRGEGLAGWALAHDQTLRLGEHDPRPASLTAAPRFRSALVVPLYRQGEPFGALECVDRIGGDFTDADFDRLEVMAESLGFALAYALLYQSMERRALEKDVLLEITKALAAPFDLEEVIETIFQSLRQVVDYDAGAIYLVNKTTHRLEMVAESGYPQGSEEAFDLMIGQGVVGWVAKTGEPVIVPDVTADRRYVAARPETRSEIAAPLVIEGGAIGVFNLESDIADAYHEGHLDLLTAFAAQAATAVERARTARDLVEQRRLERELVIARQIQASFLPKEAPHVEGFDLAGTTQSHDEVGGDYFDFIPVSATRLGLAIADSSGKGIPAALLMAGFRMSLLAEIRNEFAIRAIMRKVNVLLHESTERDRFVTAFYGLLDWKNGVLTFSNAGHNPPILRHPDGRFEQLHEGGLALGVLPDALYEDRPVALEPGAVLVMYTDGVSESENEQKEQFGVERIEAVIAAHAHRTAAELVDHIVGAVVAFAGEHGPNDDLTLLVLKAKGTGPAA